MLLVNNMSDWIKYAKHTDEYCSETQYLTCCQVICCVGFINGWFKENRISDFSLLYKAKMWLVIYCGLLIMSVFNKTR